MLPHTLLALLALLVDTSAAQQAPLLGDTTSSLAILFSPPFLPLDIPEPTYPNYTLPDVQPSFDPPSNPPNYTLIVFPTTDTSPIASNDTSPALLRAVTGATVFHGNASDSSLVLRDQLEGWRTQWIVADLIPSSNYTAFTVNELNQTVAGPVFFLTKSPSFSCTLVHSVPYCPFLSYAVPLAPPQNAGSSSTDQTYSAATLPDDVLANTINGTLLPSLANFSIALSSFACGRDVYSPLRSCFQCYEAYRDWACAVSFPRCGDPIELPPSPLPQPAFRNSSTRNGFPTSGTSFYELLPCLETCNVVDRSCPYLMQFKCPDPGVTAGFSYGVGFIDNAVDGIQGAGDPGVAAKDGWTWCNAGTNYDY